MSILVVMDNSKQWPLSPSEIGPNVEIVGAKQYITNPEYAARPRAKVFNLCRSYKYQTIGYYVSLLAEARGHRVIPSVRSINDLRRRSLYGVDIEDLNQNLAKFLPEGSRAAAGMSPSRRARVLRWMRSTPLP